jgi:APA family basic amino acid/polyamine antiporter
VIQTGMIAAVSVAFSKFASYIFPVLSEINILLHTAFIGISAAQLFGIVQIILLSYTTSVAFKPERLYRTF